MLLTKTIFGKPKVRTYSDLDVNRFIDASGIKTVKEKDAINYLITQLKSNSLWDKMQVVYPMAGSTAHNHKFNAKNPIDSDLAFRITWFGSEVHDSNGYNSVLNGGYGNLHFIPSFNQNVNSHGLTIAVGSFLTTGTGIQLGSQTTQSSSTTIQSYDKQYGFVYRMDGTARVFSNSDGKGIYTAQRISSTINNAWKNGIKMVTQGANGTLPNIPYYIGGLNGNGYMANKGTSRIQSVYIHEGLSDAEVVLLNTIIDNYENQLSRKTW